MHKVLDYIQPIFFTFSQNGNGVYVFEALTRDGDRFKENFTIDVASKDNMTIEELLYNLSLWLPDNRRFFCSSSMINKEVLTSENLKKINSLLTKRINLSIWAEIISYFNIDTYLNNIGIGSYEELDFIEHKNKIDHIVTAYTMITKDKYDDKVLNILKNISDTMDGFKNSLNWVELVRGGNTSLEDIFNSCGNHMLGKSFDISKERNSIKLAENTIDIKVNRETAIADIQEMSILNTTKVFIDITKEGSVYTFNALYNEGIKIRGVFDLENLNEREYLLINAIPLRRTFIGYGKETLEYAKELSENEKIHEVFRRLMKEITDTYIDMNKPFEKILLGKSLKDLMKIFSVKVDENKCKNLSRLDKKIFNNVTDAINKSVEACYTYLVPLTKENAENAIKNIMTAAFGQSFKYFYNVSNDIE